MKESGEVGEVEKKNLQRRSYKEEEVTNNLYRDIRDIRDVIDITDISLTIDIYPLITH